MSDLADVIRRAVKDLRELRNRNDVADDLEAALSLPPEPPTPAHDAEVARCVELARAIVAKADT